MMTRKRNRCIVSIVHRTILLLICFLLVVVVVCVVVPVRVEATEIKWIPNNNNNDKKKEAGNINAENAPKSQKYWNDNNIQRPDYAKTDNEIAFEKRQMGSSTFTLPKWLVGFIMSSIFGIIAAKYLLNQYSMNDLSNFTMSSFGTSTSNNNTTSTTTTNKNNDEKMRLARLAKFTTETTTTTTTTTTEPSIHNSLTKID